MQRQDYPSLGNDEDMVFLDASAAFPIHQNVRDAVVEVMNAMAGNDSKGSYAWSLEASEIVSSARKVAGAFLNVGMEDIVFSHSASDAVDRLLAHYVHEGVSTIVYSKEDHSSIISAIDLTKINQITMNYRMDGTLAVPSDIIDSPKTVFILSHMHHLYGSVNNIEQFRKEYPQSRILVDASQSASRMKLNVKKLDCDALFFSGQKVGGIGGVGIVYIKNAQHHNLSIEPHTLPLHAIVAVRAAMQLLLDNDIDRISLYLDRLTTLFIMAAQDRIPGMIFSKGPANSHYACSGNGIISFKIDGYSSLDIAMILEDEKIFVRAADHCVDDSEVDRDVVRVSMHAYTTQQDINRLVDVLSQLG